MLNLHWALERNLLDDVLDADLVAFSAGLYSEGTLHLDGCWDLIDADSRAQDRVEDDTATDDLPRRVRLAPMSWKLVQSLADAAPTGTTDALCACLAQPSPAHLPNDVHLATLAGDLAAALAQAEPTKPAQLELLAALAATFAHRNSVPGTLPAPLVAAVDELAADAASRIAAHAEEPATAQTRRTYLHSVLRHAQPAYEGQPSWEEVRDGDDRLVAETYEAVEQTGTWFDVAPHAVPPQLVLACALTLQVDPEARRLRLRLPSALTRSRRTLLTPTPDSQLLD